MDARELAERMYEIGKEWFSEDVVDYESWDKLSAGLKTWWRDQAERLLEEMKR